MLAYLKPKTTNEELYESDYLKNLKQKNSYFSQVQYWICFFFFEMVACLKGITNSITVKQIQGGILLILPFSIEKCDLKLEKAMKHVQQLMKKYQITNLVLAEELKRFSYFSKEENIFQKQVHIIDGKGIMPYLLKEIIEYILKIQQKPMELEDLYLCMKQNSKIYLDNIYYLTHYFKTINIITPNITTFQKIADDIEEKENIVITVSNNKKKSLKKARLIVNFDFEEKEIKKYTIFRRAILIILNHSNPYESVGFDGIQVRHIGVDMSKDLKDFFNKYHLLETCSLTSLCESLINTKQEFLQVKHQLEKEKVEVIKLYGTKGEIGKKQYLDVAS